MKLPVLRVAETSAAATSTLPTVTLSAQLVEQTTTAPTSASTPVLGEPTFVPFPASSQTSTTEAAASSTAAAASSSPTVAAHNGSGFDSLAIAGVVCGILGFIALGGLIWFFWRRLEQQKKSLQRRTEILRASSNRKSPMDSSSAASTPTKHGPTFLDPPSRAPTTAGVYHPNAASYDRTPSVSTLGKERVPSDVSGFSRDPIEESMFAPIRRSISSAFGRAKSQSSVFKSKSNAAPYGRRKASEKTLPGTIAENASNDDDLEDARPEPFSYQAAPRDRAVGSIDNAISPTTRSTAFPQDPYNAYSASYPYTAAYPYKGPAHRAPSQATIDNVLDLPAYATWTPTFSQLEEERAHEMDATGTVRGSTSAASTAPRKGSLSAAAHLVELRADPTTPISPTRSASWRSRIGRNSPFRTMARPSISSASGRGPKELPAEQHELSISSTVRLGSDGQSKLLSNHSRVHSEGVADHVTSWASYNAGFQAGYNSTSIPEHMIPKSPQRAMIAPPAARSRSKSHNDTSVDSPVLGIASYNSFYNTDSPKQAKSHSVSHVSSVPASASSSNYTPSQSKAKTTWNGLPYAAPPADFVRWG